MQLTLVGSGGAGAFLLPLAIMALNPAIFCRKSDMSLRGLATSAIASNG
jgi:hypothetical protein